MKTCVLTVASLFFAVLFVVASAPSDTVERLHEAGTTAASRARMPRLAGVPDHFAMPPTLDDSSHGAASDGLDARRVHASSTSPSYSIPRRIVSAEDSVATARALVRDDASLSVALNPLYEVKWGDSEGFVSERGELVSAGERLLRVAPRAALAVHVPRDANGAFAVEPDGEGRRGFELRLVGASASPRAHAGGVVVYRNADTRTDVLVRTSEKSTQFLYVLQDENAPHTFAWKVSLGDARTRIEQRGDGTLVALDRRGEDVLRMPVGVAFDANGKRIAVRPRWDAESSTITWALDRVPEAFPVLVDPIIETPAWQQVESMLEREDEALAYDASRGEIVLFGGAKVLNGTSFRLLGDTWTWDGITWSRRALDAAPPARRGHAMVYDAARGEVVLFGGQDNDYSELDDTWTWDGTTWTRETPNARPRGRRTHALAYDAARGEVVLFGGGRPGYPEPFGDTWTWNGSTWTEERIANGPRARIHHAMVYDAARAEVVLFGGGANGEFDDFWGWNGVVWTEKHVSPRPPARTSAAIAYDAARELVVITSGRPSTDRGIWTWNGAEWSQSALATPIQIGSYSDLVYDAAHERLVYFEPPSPGRAVWFFEDDAWTRAPEVTPAPRTGHEMAFDAARGEVVLFGGAQNDTWTWNGSRWTRRTVTSPPPARRGHALAYDAARENIVMFGGVVDQVRTNGTFTWDGVDWSESSVAAPPVAREGHAMAFDEARQEVVLFGGYGTEDLRDTWTWNGAAWSAESTPPTLAARYWHAMAYDVARSEVVLFGGFASAGSTYLGDTWTWNGSHWTQASTPTSPAGRRSHEMAYDTSRDAIVLFGGALPSDPYASDTWIWNGSTWTRLGTAGALARREHAMTYDRLRNELVLFGGWSPASTSDGQTWVLRSSRASSSDCTRDDQCASGFCVEGVCCDTACGRGSTDDCMSCLESHTGVASGTCSGLAFGQPKPVCRPARGACDVPETCITGQARCPFDATATVSRECRAAAGPCDIADMCDGSNPECPPDRKRDSSFVCRSSDGSCDVEERCDGSIAGCPSDALRPSTHTCRFTTNVCDVAENCTGTTATCPDDDARPEGSSCGGAPVGECDAQDVCQGSVGAWATCASRYAPRGVECGVPICTDGVVQGPSSCSGASAVCSMRRTSCAPYFCDGDGCSTECDADTDCVPRYHCDDRACVRGLASGAACSESRRCASGVCARGVCAQGLAAGEACTRDALCASGVCSNQSCASLTQEDAGVDDAGASDAGGESSSDGGCSCRASQATAYETTPTYVLLAMVAFIFRRRRVSPSSNARRATPRTVHDDAPQSVSPSA